jgi:hypothetical protein
MEVSGWPHAPATLSLQKETWYPLNMRLFVPENRTGHFEEGNISCACYDFNPRLFSPDCYYTNYTIAALFSVKCKLQLQMSSQQRIIIPGYRSGDYVPSGDIEILYHLYTQCIHVFCIILAKNNDYFPKQH